MTTHKLNSDRRNDRELTLDELEIVSGGDGKTTTTKTSSGKGSSSQVYLRYDFTEVF